MVCDINIIFGYQGKKTYMYAIIHLVINFLIHITFTRTKSENDKIEKRMVKTKDSCLQQVVHNRVSMF